MVHRLADEAVADLDHIWWRIAKYTGNAAVAQNTIITITERFICLLANPVWGGRAMT